MTYSVTWSPTAQLSYYRVLEYLDDRWTRREIESFVNRTEEVISHICKNPLLYPYSKESEIHKCVLIKQVSLFYRKRALEIELLLFWDNRQDPAKLLL